MLARGIGVPHFFHIRYGAIDGINDILEKEGIIPSQTLITSGTKFTRTIADKLEIAINGNKSREYIDSNDVASIRQVEETIARLDPSLVVGVGGGKVLDVTKYSCLRLDKPFIAIPTVLSNDGISSPISVVGSNQGIKSIGSEPPIGIIVDLGVVKNAPRKSILAGIGDLISNLSAVDDWNIASKYAGEKVDRFAEILAKNSADGFIQYMLGKALSEHVDASVEFDDKMIVSLAEGLIQSGMAMSLAGSSRPCSGSEHLISHALDELLNFEKPHGLQVGLATILTSVLHGREISDLMNLYRKIDFPTTPEALGIPMKIFADAIGRAPATRKERFTVLNIASGKEVDAALVSAYGTR